MNGTSTVAIEVSALVGVILIASFADFRLFGRGKSEPSFRDAVYWSIGWVILALAAALVIWPTKGGDDAVLYLTVYLIERSLSLDNVFVFLLLFTYFSIRPKDRTGLILWGIVAALALRGIAILGGVELLDRFGFLIYVLGGLLLVLAIRVGAGMAGEMDPDLNLMVRLVRRIFPVSTERQGSSWFVRPGGEGSRLHVTPVFLCLTALIFTDLIFAVDSIPAAFAITRDPFVIWAANVFALLGLRSLIIVVERLIEQFRYLDETIAVVLGAIAVKLILEEAGLIHIGPIASLGVVGAIFAVGITASVIVGPEEEPADAETRPAEPDPPASEAGPPS
jgi:tellurite resistance protein TerC